MNLNELKKIYFDLYDKLNEPERSKAKEYWHYDFVMTNFPKTIPTSPAQAIKFGFIWVNTKEGHYFWAELEDELYSNKINMTNKNNETKKADVHILNSYSSQKWINIEEAVPVNFNKIEVQGDYFGKYICLLERPFISEEQTFSNMKILSIENCHWNTIANKFQDKNNEWVDVIAWMPFPEMIIHKITPMLKNEILNKIKNKEFELIGMNKEKNVKSIPGMWELIKKRALFHVSFKEEVYFSSEFINGYEECIWAKKTNETK